MNMLGRIGAAAQLADDPESIARADRIILPGVGAFDHAMERLEGSGLLPVLERQVCAQRVPLLGICLGMQLLTRGSEEGTRPGLAWVPADTVRFQFGQTPAPRLPHMGWGEVRTLRPDALFEGLAEDARFYFVHGYHVRCDVADHELARCTYGGPFTVAFRAANVCGVQFHPERSHRFGMQLLRNFASGIA
jgi:glutamine amidotransferase